MIKINLLLDSGGTGAAVAEAGSAGLSNTDEEKRELRIKIALIFAPIIIYYIYTFYTNTATKGEVKRLQAQVAEAQTKLKTLDPDVKDIEKFQEEKRKLDSQLDVIKKLSKERLKNVKS